MTHPSPDLCADPIGVPLRDRIAAFLAEHTTLSLATVGPDGAPAAAAVFYAHDAGFNLYFLSEERTAHGRNLLADPRVSGTIHADGQDWRGIRGLQVRGQARPAAGPELARAAVVYGRKYAFVGGLLAGSGGAGTLAGPLARARFWVLQPTWFRLIDNTVQFGFKEEWVLNEGRIRTIVLGIFLHEDRLLVFRGDDPARDVVFYRPLGGGIEFGERSADAFVREMREELGAELTAVRYLGMIENIFTHAGKRGHEVVLLYAARFTDPAFYARLAWTGDDNGLPIPVMWKPLADFRNGDLLVPRELLAFLDGHDCSA